MLINVKQVKLLTKSYKKQVSKEFLDQLEYRIRALVNKAVINSKNFKRLKASELL